MNSTTTFSINNIVAIVNDNIISQYDIENRLDLLIRKFHLAQTPTVRRHLLPQVLQILIDETLQMQSAMSLQLKISNLEISRTISDIIERQMPLQNKAALNTLTEPTEVSFLTTDSLSLDSFLTTGSVTANSLLTHAHHSNGQETGYFKNALLIDLLIDAIRSEIAWKKIVQHTVHPQVGESEIDTALQMLHNTEHQTQNLLAEICLPVDNSTQEEAIRVFAEQLVGQVRTGADFKAIARQFSQAASAIQGGDIGWIFQGQLELAIENVLHKMQPGQLSMPIRTLAGYTIILLRERLPACLADNTRLTLHQLFIPLTGPEAISTQIQSQWLSATQMISSCEAFDALIQQTGTSQSGHIGQLRAADLLPTLRAAVLPLAPYKASAPVPLNGGLAVLMVCDRNSPKEQSDIPSREIVEQQLKKVKIETIRHKRLHHLRRAAFIEVRSQ